MIYTRQPKATRRPALAAIATLILILSLLVIPTLSGGTAGPSPSNDQQPQQNGFIPPLAPLQQEGDGEEGEGEEEAPAEESTIAEPEQTGDDVVQAPINLVEIVVAATDIPAGTRITADLLELEPRPVDNVAIRARVYVDNVETLVGRIVKNDIPRGQEILTPMIALSATDLANFGSDLSLFVDQGRVAVAFPLDRYSGVAYAMRSGDFVDVMMTFNMVELDLEFQTILPNRLERVNEAALEAGQPFLFPATSLGRLEVVEELGNQVVQITPQSIIETQDVVVTETTDDGGNIEVDANVSFPTFQRARRTTQLTVQQAEVLWVGTWDVDDDESRSPAIEEPETLASELETDAAVIIEPEPIDPRQGERGELRPDVVVLSLPLQDALVIKWALEEPGADVDLALRAQGDNALYVTTSVNLPQLVEQAGLSIPEPSQFDLQPRIDFGGIPRLPAQSPERARGGPN